MKRREIGLALAALALAAPRPARADNLPFRRGSWDALRRRHAGRPTIVHFWGLTCGPCLEELPQWGKFRQTLRGTDLVLIAADPLPQAPEWVAETLGKSGLTGLESWQFAERFSERLFWEVDHAWQGELPFTVLLPANGAPSSALGEADFDALTAWSKAG